MSIPITKHNFLIRSAEELLTAVPKAFHIASSGRPGPVLIDIPKDVQLETIDLKTLGIPVKEEDTICFDPTEIEKAAQMINRSQRPIIFAGGGVIISGASEQLMELSRINSIPVTSSLMGLGSIPAEDEMFIGMLGMHGQRYTNHIMHKTDLLIALGTRFDDRATGKVKEFCPHAKIIHIDIDSSEINKIKRADIAICADIAPAIAALLPLIERSEREEWKNTIKNLRKKYPIAKSGREDHKSPGYLINLIGEIAKNTAIITTDVGQHQMWVAQFYPFTKPRTFLTSGGLGTMGFGFPAALGASLANPGTKVICFSGDGSILMNIQELALLSELNLDIKIIIFNNRTLGLVRQQQEYFYGKEYIGSQFYCKTDFAKIAEGFGIESFDLSSSKDPMKFLRIAIQKEGPILINIPLDKDENVNPMVAPGKANYEMIGGEVDE